MPAAGDDMDALAALATKNALTDETLGNLSLHIVCNLYIRITGSTAWAEGYSVVLFRSEKMFGVPYGVFTCGHNHWDFERDGERWLLKRRNHRSVSGQEAGAQIIAQYLEDDRPAQSRAGV